MEPYKIVLLVLILLFFVYFVFFLYVFSHILNFSKRMKKRLRALDIMLSEKSIHLLSMKENYESLGIVFSDADKASLKELKRLKFEKSTYDSVCYNRAAIDKAEKRLSYIALTSPVIQTDPINASIRANLEDLDRNFRRCSALYNSDLIAYNYWITIPGIRLFVLLFRFHKAKAIG